MLPGPAENCPPRLRFVDVVHSALAADLTPTALAPGVPSKTPPPDEAKEFT